MSTIPVLRDSDGLQKLLNDVDAARDTAVSARDESKIQADRAILQADRAILEADRAASKADDAASTAADIGALGGIDGTVQATSDLPSSTGSDEYYYVVDQAAYYKDTGNGAVQGGWEQSGPDLAGLGVPQEWTAQQDFLSATFKEGPFFDVTHPDFGAVGDGSTDDGPAIQAAIDACEAAGGGIVFFPPTASFYKIPDGVVVGGNASLTKNVVLMGAGAASELSQPDTDTTQVGATDGIQIDNVENCRITNLKLTGNPNLVATDPNQTAINGANDVINCTFDNLIIETWGYDGINLINNGYGNVIAYNRVDNVGDDGINPGGGGDAGVDPTKTTILGNHVSNCGSDGIHLSQVTRGTSVVGNVVDGCLIGVSIFNSSEATISANVIRNCTAGVATSRGDTTETFGVTVSNNVLYGITADGIVIEHGHRHGVVNNRINMDSGSNNGIKVRVPKVQILQNRIVTPVGSGILLQTSGEENDVKHNYIENADIGIELAATLTGLSVESNEIINCANGVQWVGGGGDNATFINNRLKEIANYGLRIERGFRHAVIGNYCKGTFSNNAALIKSADSRIVANEFLKSGGGTVLAAENSNQNISENLIDGSGDGDGIYSDSSKQQITNNLIRNVNRGLYTIGGDQIIESNRFESVNNYGIYANGSSGGSKISDNVVKGSPQFGGIRPEESGCVVADNVCVSSKMNAATDGFVHNNVANSIAANDPNTRYIDNDPAIDAHRGQTDGNSDNDITVSFDKPYASRPALDFGRRGGGINGISFSTNTNGNYDGVTITIASAGGTIDLFVQDG